MLVVLWSNLSIAPLLAGGVSVDWPAFQMQVKLGLQLCEGKNEAEQSDWRNEHLYGVCVCCVSKGLSDRGTILLMRWWKRWKDDDQDEIKINAFILFDGHLIQALTLLTSSSGTKKSLGSACGGGDGGGMEKQEKWNGWGALSGRKRAWLTKPVACQSNQS